MPYIEQGLRPELDEIVQLMHIKGVHADGDLNYILFAYCKYHVTASYNNYKNYIGELEECATEIRRRILANYEDAKLLENGDV